LIELGINNETLLKSIKINENLKDDAPKRLLDNQSINKFSNFIMFGQMMNEKFNEFYNPAINTEKLSKTTLELENDEIRGKKFIRVLWDIENIQVPKQLGGINTVKRLQTFFLENCLKKTEKKTEKKSNEALNEAIDLRITAFFSADGPNSMPKKVVNELDKG
jgi:hypothetical protein